MSAPRCTFACECGQVLSSKHAARHRRSCVEYQCGCLRRQHALEIGRLQAELEKERARKRRRVVIHKTTTHQQHNSLTINVVPFGQEPRLPDAVVANIISHPMTSVPAFIKAKHLDLAECANLRLHNNRLVRVMQEDARGKVRWMYRDKHEVLDDLQHDALDTLITDYHATANNVWNSWYVQSELDQQDFTHKKEWKRNERNVEALLRNHGGELAPPP